MSVPQNQREEGELTACKKAHDLCVYTLRITSNPKVFVQEYNSFKAKIEESALNIHIKAWRANNVFVNNVETATMRDMLQIEAINHCIELLAYIDIAKNIYHLDSKRVKYWAEMVMEVKNLLRAWHETDKKRYAEVRNGM